jgi:hypothetical protein
MSALDWVASVVMQFEQDETKETGSEKRLEVLRERPTGGVSE